MEYTGFRVKHGMTKLAITTAFLREPQGMETVFGEGES